MAQSASQSAVGQLQAVQAANQIAAIQANQLAALHQTMQATSQVMLNSMAANDADKVNTVNVLNQIHNAPLVKGGF